MFCAEVRLIEYGWPFEYDCIDIPSLHYNDIMLVEDSFEDTCSLEEESMVF